ncbi:MAG: 2,3-bisphosphoglycerate-independent phosphoglycerate mutase [Aquificaceae bacterium]
MLEPLVQKNDNKILLIVLDGIGGLPIIDGKTELELAKTPNLDSLTKNSALGLHIPVDYGITPGSGPGHLGIFGYDPLEYEIGRGILEALGLGLQVEDTDIAIRGNYATAERLNGKLVIKDRRAGRIPTEENRRITQKLSEAIKEIDGVKVYFSAGMEHRIAILLRFPEPLPEGSDKLSDTDPQKEGLEPIKPVGLTEASERVAKVVQKLLERIEEVLRDEPKANYVLLRGFSQKPKMESFEKRFGLRACAIAVYPMYKGLASLVGMDLISFEGQSIEDQIKTLKDVWQNYDFFFLHIKKTDSFGEDGNYQGKVKVIEEFDKNLPSILELKPKVLVITGDHSTPSVLKGHSWHPVPVLLHSPYVLGGTSERFTERECLKGELGIFPAKKLINLMLAHSLRLAKYGA